MNLLTPAEIKRTAAIVGRQAEERALLDGRHENERRELQAKHRAEMEAAAKSEAAPLAPVVAPAVVATTNGKGRRA